MFLSKISFKKISKCNNTLHIHEFAFAVIKVLFFYTTTWQQLHNLPDLSQSGMKRYAQIAPCQASLVKNGQPMVWPAVPVAVSTCMSIGIISGREIWYYSMPFVAQPCPSTACTGRLYWLVIGYVFHIGEVVIVICCLRYWWITYINFRC